MKPDTILFVLSEIARELQKADINRQLYLIERRNINLKRLEEMEDENQEKICEFCKEHVLPDYNLGINSLCEGAFCEEASELYYESENE